VERGRWLLHASASAPSNRTDMDQTAHHALADRSTLGSCSTFPTINEDGSERELSATGVGRISSLINGNRTFRHRADKSDSSGSVDLQSTSSVIFPDTSLLPVLRVRRNSNWPLHRELQERKSSADSHGRFLSERLETHPHARRVDLRLHGMRSRGPSFPLSVSSSETGR
jgi:hypothetical protein